MQAFGAGSEGRRSQRALPGCVELAEKRPHRRATVTRQFAGDEINHLNPVGALVNRRNPNIAQMLRRPGFLYKPHAAMHLNT